LNNTEIKNIQFSKQQILIKMRYCIMLFLSILTVLTLSANNTVAFYGWNDSISVKLQITNPTCSGFGNGQILAIPSGGRFPFTYAWSNGSTQAAIFGLSEGTYSVTVTDATGLKATTTATITPPKPIQVEFRPVGSICEGYNTDYIAVPSNGTPPYSFLWSNGRTTDRLDPTAEGAYFVTVIDANGCRTTATLLVNAPLDAEVITKPVQCFDFCDGSAQALTTGGARPYSYRWSNGGTTAVIESLPAGQYTVTITDANGCQIIRGGKVTSPPEIKLNLQLTGTCDENGTITATVNPQGGSPAYQIRWRVGSGDSIVTGVNSITNLVRGKTYSVTVTDQNGCRAIEDIIVPTVAGLVIDVNKRDIACAENNTGWAAVTPRSGTAPYTYNWSNGKTDSLITNLRQGNYQVTVTDASGCTARATVTITKQADLLLQLDATASCDNEGTGMANVVPRSGQAPYAFRWNDSQAQTTGTAVNLRPGTYTVTVIDALGCIGVQSIEVPAIKILVEVQIDTVNNTATATPSGGIPPYAYRWSNGQTTATATNLVPGETYTVTVTDQNGEGCEGTATITIPKRPTNDLVISVSATPSCKVPASGMATVIISGGNAPYKILWSNGQTAVTATGLAPGEYTVTVTDADGNSKTATITVDAFQFDFELTSTPQGCSNAAGGSARVNILEGESPFTYLWSNGQTTSSINNVTAGTYKVTVTDNRGCVVSKEVIISKTRLTLDVEVVNAGCTGEATGSATVIPSGGTEPYSYAWTTGATTATIENLVPGFYEVIVTDATFCQEAAFVNINKENIGIAIKSTNVSCSGELGSATVDTVIGGEAPFIYRWSNSTTTRTITGLSVGEYQVTVTDARGCTGTGKVTIQQVLNLNLITSNTACNQNTGRIIAIPSLGQAPFNFLWSNGETGSFIENVGAGEYTVTVTDNKQCVGMATSQVTEENTLALSALATSASCGTASNGTATIRVTSGESPYQYRWENRADTTATINNLMPGTYKATVTDANTCTREISVTVGTTSSINVTIPSVASCEGEEARLSVINNQPEDVLSYRWIPSDAFLAGTDTTSTPVYTKNESGNVSVVITKLGCSIEQMVAITITERTRPDVSRVTYQESCSGQIVTFNGNGQTEGYIWRFGDPNSSNDISNELNPTFTYSQPGTYIVTLIPVNSAACRDTAQFSLLVKGPETLTFAVDGDKFVCDENTTSLSINDAKFTTFEWYAIGNPNNVVSRERTYLAREGTYRVVAKTAEGCVGEQTVTVSNENVNITLEDAYAVCRGEELSIEVNNLNENHVLTYDWISDSPNGINDPQSDMPTFNVNQTTTFTVTVDNQFCSLTKEVTIEVKELPEIEGVVASPDTINNGETSNISIRGAKGNYKYNWSTDPTLSSFNGPSTIASPTQTNIYNVTITNDDGCEIKPEVRVVVLDLPCEDPYVYIPNAFTPNSDGINDILYVRGFHIERMWLIIYNRWGEKVFETRNQKEGWDGTYKNESATGDVFGYYLEVECIGNESNIFKGNITILK